MKKMTARILRGLARRLDPLPRIVNPQVPRECSICGYVGYFQAFGVVPRPDSGCPNCGSGDRHRFFKLCLERRAPIPQGARVLHFAAEECLTKLVRPIAGEYLRADIDPGKGDVVVDIQRIDFEEGRFDTVICLHVLEHVDDAKALAEIHRVLADDGLALLMVPIVDGWDVTYEAPDPGTPQGRIAHFGQNNHVRFYGRDFRDRVRAAGFAVEEITASGPDCARYGLVRGEKLFLARKER